MTILRTFRKAITKSGNLYYGYRF